MAKKILDKVAIMLVLAVACCLHSCINDDFKPQWVQDLIDRIEALENNSGPTGETEPLDVEVGEL